MGGTYAIVHVKKQGNKERILIPELNINVKSIKEDYISTKKFSSFHDLRVQSEVKLEKSNSILLREEHQHFDKNFIENKSEEDLNKSCSIDLKSKGIINPSFK